MSVFVFVRGPLTGSRVELGHTEVLMGRGPQCSVSVLDVSVSRLHAVLRPTPDGWEIEDQSKSGTYVNGRRIEKVLLSPGDEVRLGNSAALFDPAFDLLNADFTNNSVILSSATAETVAIRPQTEIDIFQPQEEAHHDPAYAGVEFIVEIGELFDSSNTSFGDTLRSSAERISRMLRTDALMVMLHDPGAGGLRVSAAVAGRDEVQADTSMLMRVLTRRRAVLFTQPPIKVTEDSQSLPARSVVAAPLATPEQCVGVLYCERDESDPFTLRELRLAVSLGRLLAVFLDTRRRADALELRLNYDLADSDVIGKSPAFSETMKMLNRVAATPATALLVGETGVGKEVLAREIHRASPQGERKAPFIPVNCAAIPDTLFESELFGHEKGSFTGAHKLRLGYIEQANGGTLFLDEIGEMDLSIQPKLLRFLQEKTFTRVGGTRLLRAEVRIVAATNRNLLEEVEAGRFREDLYHRLAVFPIRVPPLRERGMDIRLLAERFCLVYGRKLRKPITRISEDAMALLENYSWPGNVRELANCIERAVLLCDGDTLMPSGFLLGRAGMAQTQTEASQAAQGSFVVNTNGNGSPDLRPLSEVEKEHILHVLENSENASKACETLGIHRNTLRNKLKEWGMV